MSTVSSTGGGVRGTTRAKGRRRRRSRSGWIRCSPPSTARAGGWKPSAMRSSPSRVGWRRCSPRPRTPSPRSSAGAAPRSATSSSATARRSGAPSCAREPWPGCRYGSVTSWAPTRPSSRTSSRPAPGASPCSSRASSRWAWRCDGGRHGRGAGWRRRRASCRSRPSSITRSRRRCSSRRSPRGGSTPATPGSWAWWFPSWWCRRCSSSPATSSRRPYDRRSTPSAASMWPTASATSPRWYPSLSAPCSCSRSRRA